MDILWHKDQEGKETSYADLYKAFEIQHCHFNFTHASVPDLFELFTRYEQQCQRLIEEKLVYPAYDFCLKCSHTFNLLDARSAISVSERTAYILRIRTLARACAEQYINMEEHELST